MLSVCQGKILEVRSQQGLVFVSVRDVVIRVHLYDLEHTDAGVISEAFQSLSHTVR